MVLRGFLKFLIGLIITVFLLAGVIGVIAYFSLRDFDPNHFRAEIEQTLSRQSGLRVELGVIHLQWGLRPELRVDSLKLSHPQNREDLLQSGPLRLQADLTTIRYRLFNVSHVLIQDPHIMVTRKPDGTWNWQNQAATAGSVDGVRVNPQTNRSASTKVSKGSSKWIRNAG